MSMQERDRKRNATPKRKAYMKARDTTPERREWHRVYNAKLENRMRRWEQKGLPQPTRPVPSVCECCGKSPGQKGMHLDHDHDTGMFRGWLCNACNRAIGLLGDNVVGVRHALNYLELR